MNLYVLGFAFSADGKLIVLIEKQKPDWQKGKFNGIGGKVEEGESWIGAMVREFREETGVLTKQEDWVAFAMLQGDNYQMYCYRMFSDKVNDVRTQEKEMIHLLPYNKWISDIVTLVDSLKVLLPMAADKNFKFAIINHEGRD